MNRRIRNALMHGDGPDYPNHVRALRRWSNSLYWRMACRMAPAPRWLNRCPPEREALMPPRWP